MVLPFLCSCFLVLIYNVTATQAYTASIVCEAAERSATCSPIQCRTKGTVGDASPRFRVVATDIDRDSLDAAEEGIYPAVGNMFSFVEDDVPHEARVVALVIPY